VSVESVRAHLARFGREEDIRVFDGSSHTVAQAAEQIGTEPARIAKTLAFLSPTGPDTAILVVAAGDAKVNGGEFKRRFGGKGSMVPAERLVELTGHPVGGVCPFANPPSAEVWLDESLRRFDLVWPAAGSPDSAVPIELTALPELSAARGWVDLCTGWREERAAN